MFWIDPLMSPPRRDLVGRALMALAALGALAAVATVLPGVRAAPSQTFWVEAWRLTGLGVFAGLFALLALRPRRSAGVWELTLLHKAALAGIGLAMPGAGDAAAHGAVDIVLVMLIVAAWFCCRGWLAWRSPPK